MSKDPSTLLLEHHLKALKLPTFVIPLLDTTDFGTIVNDISTKARTPAVPTAPYVVQ